MVQPISIQFREEDDCKDYYISSIYREDEDCFGDDPRPEPKPKKKRSKLIRIIQIIFE